MNRRKKICPCEDNFNRGRVDGREEGRTGVQVERVKSEVVLICDGYKQGRRVQHAVM